MGADAIGTSLYIDYSDFARGIAEANRLIKLNEQQFKTASASLDDWSNTSEGLETKLKSLSKTIELQKGKVSALEQEYKKVKEEKGEHSTTAQAFALKLEKERTALANSEKEARNYTKKLHDLKSASKEAEQSSKGLGGAFKSLLSANLVASAIGVVTNAVGSMISSFLGASEATKEYRTNLAKVEQTAKTMGESVGNAKENMLAMASISGDVESAGEAVNNLLSAGIKGDNLDKITKQLEGASIKWKDTLKLEGLADGLQETLATGSATGAFGELLERGGKSLDDFNARLAKCTTTAEQQELVMQELSSMGLEKVSESYREANKNLVDAELAQLKYNDTMARVGTAMEPVITVFTNMKTAMLEMLLPAIQQITKGITMFAQGASGAGQVIAGGFLNAITSIGAKIAEVGKTILSSAVAIVPELLSKLTQILPHIIALIADYLQLALMTVTNKLPEFTQFVTELFPQIIDGLVNGFNTILEKLPGLITGLFSYLGEAFTSITEISTNAFLSMSDGLDKGLTALKNNLPKIVDAITTGLKDFLPKVVDGATNLFNGVLKGLETMLKSLSKNLPDIIKTIQNAIKEWLPIIADKGFELFMNIVKAIGKFIPVLVKELPSIIKAIVEGLLGLAGSLLEAGKTILVNIISGIKQNLPELKGIGENIVKGLWNGIKDMSSWIVEKVKGFGETVLNGFKNFFGIHSPSTVMAEQGKYLAEGLGEGIENNTSKATQSAKVFSDAVINEVKSDIEQHKQAIADILGLNVSEAVNEVDGESAGESLGASIAKGVAKGTSTTGKSVANGVKSGIATSKKDVIDVMQGLVNSLGNIDITASAEEIGWQIGDVIINALSTVLEMAYGKIGALVGSIVSLIYKTIQGVATKKDVDTVATNAGVSSTSNKIDAVHYNDEMYKNISGSITGLNDSIEQDRQARGAQYIILNQTNTSPKALNEAEIYRQSNRAINLLASRV